MPNSSLFCLSEVPEFRMLIAYIVVSILLASYLAFSAWADFVGYGQVLVAMAGQMCRNPGYRCWVSSKQQACSDCWSVSACRCWISPRRWASRCSLWEPLLSINVRIIYSVANLDAWRTPLRPAPAGLWHVARLYNANLLRASASG